MSHSANDMIRGNALWHHNTTTGMKPRLIDEVEASPEIEET